MSALRRALALALALAALGAVSARADDAPDTADAPAETVSASPAA